MIKADFSNGRITIEGHSRPFICNMVSTLCRAFEAAIKELCRNVECDITNEYGKMNIVYKAPTTSAQTLLSAFFIGLKEIERDFPEEIKVSKH